MDYEEEILKPVIADTAKRNLDFEYACNIVSSRIYWENGRLKMDYISDTNKKEIWIQSKIIEDIHYNLISTKGEDGLRKYEELARFLLYRIPIWRKPENENNQPPDFIIDVKDISDEVKKHLLSFSKEDKLAIVKEAVSLLFENLGPKEKEYFNKNVRHLLKVRCV